MAQIVTRLNVIGSPLVNSLKGESLPCAIPNRCVGYGFDQKLGGRSCSPSPPRSGTARSFMTETAPELDHYATLGVSRGASKREIKSAYRRLVLQYHPDTNRGESSTVKMMRITNAYERAMAALPPLADDVGIGGDEYVEGCYGVGDESWEEWEEWMGWEGAGTYDYSNHM